jgi:hypothetical protein
LRGELLKNANLKNANLKNANNDGVVKNCSGKTSSRSTANRFGNIDLARSIWQYRMSCAIEGFMTSRRFYRIPPRLYHNGFGYPAQMLTIKQLPQSVTAPADNAPAHVAPA